MPERASSGRPSGAPMRRGPTRRYEPGSYAAGASRHQLRFSSESESGPGGGPLLRFRAKDKAPKSREFQGLLSVASGTDGKHSCGSMEYEAAGQPAASRVPGLSTLRVQEPAFHSAGDGHDLPGHVTRELV